MYMQNTATSKKLIHNCCGSSRCVKHVKRETSNVKVASNDIRNVFLSNQ